MTNEAMREKLMTVANLLKDLTMAVVAVAQGCGTCEEVFHGGRAQGAGGKVQRRFYR